jgi:hypothetical protein
MQIHKFFKFLEGQRTCLSYGNLGKIFSEISKILLTTKQMYSIINAVSE